MAPSPQQCSSARGYPQSRERMQETLLQERRFLHPWPHLALIKARPRCSCDTLLSVPDAYLSLGKGTNCVPTWGRSAPCSPLPLRPPRLAQSGCSVLLPEQLSRTSQSSLQFHSFQSSLLPAPALNLPLHKSISKGAGERRQSAPFALAGQSCAAHAKGWGAAGGVCAPCHTSLLCKPRGRDRGDEAGGHCWRAGAGRSQA